MNRVLNVTKRGATVTIWNGLNNLEIDGTDFASDKEWRAAILAELKNQMSNWTIEEGEGGEAVKTYPSETQAKVHATQDRILRKTKGGKL